MSGSAPRIVALGGHEFRSRPPDLAIVRHLLELTNVARPRVCLLPTAGGDAQHGISGFYGVCDRFECEPSHVSLFRLEHERIDLREHLLAQDLIYAAGGSMVNLVAVWRAHGLDTILREAWERGILLAGQSAGAMCWFEQGITASTGTPEAAGGLGFVPGSLSVHWGRDPERRASYLAAVGNGAPPGYGLDDGAGLLFEGSWAVGAFAGAHSARVVRVEPRDGEVSERRIRPVVLRLATAAADPAIAELRELRRARASAGVTASTIRAWRSH